MIFVDTSVWISFFRGNDPGLVSRLSALIDEDRVALPIPVWLELLSGASKNDLAHLRRVLSALPRYSTTNVTWEMIESWVVQAVNKGQRFAIADLTIAAIAAENQSPVWSLDSDFRRLAKLGFIELAD